MGAFVIAAAVLTKVYSLDPNLVSYAYLNWYFREASVSVYVTNLPAIWALVRDIFPSLKYWGYPRRTYSDGTVHNRKGWPSQYGPDSSGQGERGLKDDLEMFDRLGIINSTDGLHANSRSQSQHGSTAPSLSEVSTADHLVIYKDVAFSIVENRTAATTARGITAPGSQSASGWEQHRPAVGHDTWRSAKPTR